jgi:large subunit ribosomal protein L35
MQKFKTRKKVSKRFKITKTGKVMKRKSGQDHFNSRESRNTTRNKRRDVYVSPTDQKFITDSI